MDAVSRLGRPVSAAWVLSLFPSAGEAVGVFQSSRRSPRVWVPAGLGRDPARARAVAAQRARVKVRRYCAANGLDRLGTLTYRGTGLHDPAVLVEHVGVFFRDLRDRLGGEAFAYVWVPEWHGSGHGLHVHFGVGQFIPRALIDAAWGHGFVHIKRLGNNLPMGAGSWEYARRTAGYLSKYVAKAIDDGRRTMGRHRYEVAQGFAPVRVGFRGASPDDVLAQGPEAMGRAPVRVWNSDEASEWRAPPTVCATWA